ncbi:protein kinase [Candidatus Neomarinimicrobiota bacterium]
MIGKTISHYKILEKLGEGSMGKVYKAEDTKLKRIVALKLLPHHLVAGKTVKQRFFHEARAASALNHPNIITIHDIHEEDGEVFIAMECVDGELLSNKLKAGPLKQKEVIDIASGIADGLNAAHNADITHRDIKSDNIIISKDGTAKILDFGLAKQKGMSQITQNGTTLGTQAYMSPEQVQSSKVDQRSDIFSFGVVMYQMATGKLPFEGEHDAAILYSIVNETPIPITTHNPNLDEELQRIINKALEKDIKDRYQHADDLLADLRKLKKGKPPKPTIKKQSKWRIPAYIFGVVLLCFFLYSTFNKKDTLPTEPVPSSKSIAVLPFSSIGDSKESEYFSDGIHDDILTQLAKIKDLKVISRSTTIQYKNSTKSLKEIAKELNVANILEGSVRRVEDRIRITTQLIDAETDVHLWAETYDRDYADIFAIQTDVALKVADALNATLNSDEKIRIAAVPTDNMEAYEYYITGNAYKNKVRSKESVENAIEMYEKAVELDPNFTSAFTKLTILHLMMYWDNINYDHTEERLKKAKDALDKAIALDPDASDVHLAQGYYYYHGSRDYKNALIHFEYAIEGQPNNADILAAIGYVKCRIGEWDVALENLIKASDLDPQSMFRINELLIKSTKMRNWTITKKYIERLLVIDKENPDGIYWKVYITLWAYGDTVKANEILEEAMEYIDPKANIIDIRRILAYVERNYKKALEICDEELEPDYRWKGRLYDLLGQEEESMVYYDSSRIFYEKRIKESPDVANNYSRLGLAYAGLGEKEKAESFGKKATTMIPISRDAQTGASMLINLMYIYLHTGEYSKAIDNLEILLSIPASITVQELKLYPQFDPIRDHPRFQELINKYEWTED